MWGGVFTFLVSTAGVGDIKGMDAWWMVGGWVGGRMDGC